MKKLITLFVLFLGLGIANAQEKKPIFGYLEYHYHFNDIYYSDIFQLTQNECGDKTFITSAKETFEKYLISQYGFKADQYGDIGFSYLPYGDNENEEDFRTREQAEEGRKRAIARIKSDITDVKITVTAFNFTCKK